MHLRRTVRSTTTTRRQVSHTAESAVCPSASSPTECLQSARGLWKHSDGPKIPYVDNIWDAIHTVIRPMIGAVLGLLVAGDADTLGQAVAATTGGLTALASHLCKAAARLVINLSPEPVTNVTASLGEDLSVASVIALVVVTPWTAAALAAVLLATSMYIVWRVHRLIRRALAQFRAHRLRSQ